MKHYLVGTGGWAYFKVPKKAPLKAYSEVFNFVEVNCTFYEYPDMRSVERWRKIVPKDFVFSVKCHQDLTHKIGLKPVDEAYEVFYKMKTYAEILQTPYLVLETPATYQETSSARDFLSTINLKGLQLIWEYRAPASSQIINLMQDFQIVHCVDLSIQKPSFNLDVTYSRLFGKGQHNIYQFDDDELAEIDQRAQDIESKTVILAYHGHRMFTDATRHIQYKKTGSFMPVTSYTGVESAKAVLSEDAKFPATKSELNRDQGWKVIDLSADRRGHLSKLLNLIPEKTYFSLNEVINQLGEVI